MKAVTLVLAIAIVASPCLARAADGLTADDHIVLERLEMDQRAVYALNLGLTNDESRDFWPLYDRYESAIRVITRRRAELLNRYADRYLALTDDDAAAMLLTIWKCEREALKVREKYAREVQTILPAVKALRYVQLQARIDSLLMARLMAAIPLATETQNWSTD